MSFITKRERVFNEYDLCDLPARNEGKLKTYASCTDARAWSHFGSDKSEHLVELIKRNNKICRPKYVPTNVIVDTLMVAKNAEITRLKRKIEEFEHMVSAYDQLDLSRDQKYEIEKAHAAIRAANKDLEELYLDLDLSGYTELSEGFETGKSRGDETSKSRGDEEKHLMMDTKAVQSTPPVTKESATYVADPRIEEMQDTIITKDAKLIAMKNTIAVMENDLCEPYCIYVHIYTALELILGILSQNDKYRQYLNLLTAGKDIRCINIKGKILFKLKVLEKFSSALISPCCQEITDVSENEPECVCYRAELMSRNEQTFALTTLQATQSNCDSKRAHLVADIIQNEEMKEILNKESCQHKERNDDYFELENHNIDIDNLNRLKNLQINYNDLMLCYESLKHEKVCLEIRYHNYEELEKEHENFKFQLREYNSMWNEKEHYRKRSVDLDKLREQYLILTDETANMETQLKAEQEINHMKCNTIDDLRKDNIMLEKKLNDASITYEKEKNTLMCKLKEAECKVMCQEQQIKSLAIQLDKLLEQDEYKAQTREIEENSIALMDEIESLKDQIKNLKDGLIFSEQEKQDLHDQYQEQLSLINALRMEMEDWKSTYEDAFQRKNYLEKYAENLSNDLNEKTMAVENLMDVIEHKSLEINELTQKVEAKENANKNVIKQLNELQTTKESVKDENKHLLSSLQLARQESQTLMDKVQSYEEMLRNETDSMKSLKSQAEENKQLNRLIDNTREEINNLKMELRTREMDNTCLLNENFQYKNVIELTQKECTELKEQLLILDDLTQQLNSLRKENEILQSELNDKVHELDNTMHCIQISKKESDEILKESDDIKNKLLKLNEAYNKLSNDKHIADKNLLGNNIIIDTLNKDIQTLKEQNEQLLIKSKQCQNLEEELKSLKNLYENLLKDKSRLQGDFDRKTEENNELLNQIKYLEITQASAQHNLEELQNEKTATQESVELMENSKLLDLESYKLKKVNDTLKADKDTLQKELEIKNIELQKIKQINTKLLNENQNILSYNEELEKSLAEANKVINKCKSPEYPYRDIIPVIEELKQEKIINQNKIRDLHHMLQESENIIANLNNSLQERDDKIAILENHINQLKNEVKLLHEDIDKLIDTGEELKTMNFQNIDTLKNIEAHHSRATHNMKMDIAQLQHENSKLDEQLTVTKVNSDDFAKENSKYISQLMDLQNERQIIISDIKQLELNSVGDSSLNPDNCEIHDILASIDRIQNYLETKKSKSFSLEQTLLKVQTSSQLLQNKADEAKKLVEKEKQKIIAEKEEAIKEKQNLENQLLNLKESLEQQIAADRIVIKDLEATMLNQKLIVDKINQSTDEYISKLQRESMTKIEALQEELRNISGEKSKQLHDFSVMKADFEEKSKEVGMLKKELQHFKDKSIHDAGVQAEFGAEYKTVETQISKEDVIMYFELDNPNIKLNENITVEKIDDAVKNAVIASYINSKLQRLQLGVLEHCTNTYPSNTYLTKDSNMSNQNTEHSKSYDINSQAQVIYHGQNISTNSSNSNEDTDNLIISKPACHNIVNITGLNKHVFLKKDKVNNTGAKREVDSDQDRFLIYKDNETSYSYDNKENAKDWSLKRNSEIIVETVTIHPVKDKDISDFKPPKINSTNDSHIYIVDEEDDSIKPKLSLNIPGAEFNVRSIGTMSGGEIKSLNSIDSTIYLTNKSLSEFDTKINYDVTDSESLGHRNPSLPTLPNEKDDLVENLPSVFRIEADSIKLPLVKNNISNLGNSSEAKRKMWNKNMSNVNIKDKILSKIAKPEENLFEKENMYSKPGRFGLEYIFDTVNRESNLNNVKYYENSENRTSKSDESMICFKTKDDFNSPIEKSDSSKQIIKSHTKSIVERSIMSNNNTNKEEYENKINNLTNALQNYEKKIEVIKEQYDSNIKNIIMEHNHGVKSIQGLHEETLQDILKVHENEIENLTSMSIEAMRKSEKLEKENRILRTKCCECSAMLDKEPIKISAPEIKKRNKSETNTLTRTLVEAFNVKPKIRSLGPCTCSLETNISDAIRNIFEQVDVEQRKIAERTYIKFIINKILSGNVETLDVQELSFLHLIICRTWKWRNDKEEALQKRIYSLESELLHKQRNTQQHFEELDRKVAEERRRLQAVRDAVCRASPTHSRSCSPTAVRLFTPSAPPPTRAAPERDLACGCNIVQEDINRLSAGDVTHGVAKSAPREKRMRTASTRAVSAKLDVDQRREKKLYNDEPPTRMRRRAHERRGPTRK